ncbi:hypothetical protein D3C76_720170 [compost metagenome]
MRLHLIEQEDLGAFVHIPKTGVFEAWRAFWKPWARALHAFGELFDQFPGGAAECHQYVYPLKQCRTDLIEVEGNDDCANVPEKTRRPTCAVGKHVMRFVDDQPVRPAGSAAQILDKGQQFAKQLHARCGIQGKGVDHHIELSL